MNRTLDDADLDDITSDGTTDDVATDDTTAAPASKAASEDATDTSDDDAQPPSRGRLAGIGGNRPAAVLAFLLVVAVAAAAFLWFRGADARDDAAALRAEATASAAVLEQSRAIAVDLTSYDYRNLEDQQKALDDVSTQAFRDKFAESNETLAPLFERLEASAKGSVVDAAVKSVDDKTAVVLLFVDQQATSTSDGEAAEEKTQGTRLRMNLVQRGGQWLVDSVDLL